MFRFRFDLFLHRLSMTNHYAVTAASLLWLFGLFAAPVLANQTASDPDLHLNESIAQSDPAIAPLPTPTSSTSNSVSESSTLLTLGDFIAQTIHPLEPATSTASDTAEPVKKSVSSGTLISGTPQPAPLIAQAVSGATQLPVPYPPKTAKGQMPPAPPNPSAENQFPSYGIPGQPYGIPVVMPQRYPYGMVPVPINSSGGMPMMPTGMPAAAAPVANGVNPMKLAPLPYPVLPYGTMPGGYAYYPAPGMPMMGYGNVPNSGMPNPGVANGSVPVYPMSPPYGLPPGNAYGVPYAAPLPPLPAPVGYAVYPGYPPGGMMPTGAAYGMVPAPGMAIAAPGMYPGMAYPGMAYPVSPYPGGMAYPGMAYPGTAYPPTYPSNYPPNYPAGYPANSYSPMGGMAPTAQMAPLPPSNVAPSGQPLPPLPTAPTPGAAVTESKPLVRSTALNKPELQFQGVYLFQGNEGSGRARVTGTLPLTRNLLFGGTVDLVDGRAFTDSPNQGINLNELYLAASIPDLPTLRFVVGQLDLTSYFDRNSFAKDGASMFFNSVFQTNPALATTGIGSRQAALVNWSVNDYVEAKAAVFSSARGLNDFSLDGFAGEVGLRFGNFIVRGTYATNRDGGRKDGFREIFQVDRGNGQTGLLRGDREEAFGVNAEVFFPEIKMGLFGRYGQYSNQAINRSASTYSVGVTFLDLFAKNDRLGVAYGQTLSNSNLRRQAGDRSPDAFEIFYDFAILPNLRLGVSYQALNGFSESILGVRIKTDFNLISPQRAQ